MVPLQLGQFINRIAMHKSHRQVDILFSVNAMSISLTQPESSTCLELHVSCESFSQQLSYMTRIFCGSYRVPFGIEHLRIYATRPKGGHDYSDCEGWRKLLRAFRGTKWAHVARGLSTDVLLALEHSEMRYETLLPALHKFCIQEPDPTPPLQKAVLSFMHSRLFSGHMIAVEYERSRINEPHRTGMAFSQCQSLLLTTSTNVLGAGFFCRDQQVMIEMLSADILLTYFVITCIILPKFGQSSPTYAEVGDRSYSDTH